MNKKGSAIILVVILSIILTIYTSSVYLKTQNYSVLRGKYVNVMNNFYGDCDDIDSIYDLIVND